MAKEITYKRLEDIKEISGKKEFKEIVYTYLNFQFKLYKQGDNAAGHPMYRMTPVNFDNKVLKTAAKKSSPSKGYSSIESANIKRDLKSILDNVVEVQKKKELARIAYLNRPKTEEENTNN